MSKYSIWRPLMLCICLTITPTQISSSVASGNNVVDWTLSTRCVDPSCVTEEDVTVRGEVECAVQCNEQSTCPGIQYNTDNNKCTLLTEGCFLSAVCSYSGNVRVYEKQDPCLHGGTWKYATSTCSCVGGWVGVFCERRAYNCMELYNYGYRHGEHRVIIDIYRNQSLLPEIVCEGGSWKATTYILNNHGRSNHPRTWQEYVNGYKLENWTFWMGLEVILAFNRMGHTDLAFTLSLKTQSDANPFYDFKYVYSDFWIRGADDGYSYTFGSSSFQPNGDENYFLSNTYTMQNIMGLSENLPFLAEGHDNDQECASKAQVGWWFPNCSSGITVNPLGRMSAVQPPDTRIHLPDLDFTDQELIDDTRSIYMAFVSK